MKLNQALVKVAEIIQEDKFNDNVSVYHFSVNEEGVELVDSRKGLVIKVPVVGVEVCRLLKKEGGYEYFVELVIKRNGGFERLSLVNIWKMRNKNDLVSAIEKFIEIKRVVK